MPRFGATPFAFPDFSGATRRLVLVNLLAFFALLLSQMALPAPTASLAAHLIFLPGNFLGGQLWQPFTYSLIHISIIGTLFELLSLWFLASILESEHGSSWVTGLYCASVLGTPLAALAIYAVSGPLHFQLSDAPLYGCMGGIFGLLVAIGVLHGDMQFLLFFVIGIKARYLAAIYALVAVAMLFGDQKMYAFAQLGGAVAGLLYIRLMPRRGFTFVLSEGAYGLRNRYYRWKRRRAARKFEVYMRKQGRTVRFDGNGRLIDEDQDDKKRWN
jgi:membrane associated rhomboid family serine protease